MATVAVLKSVDSLESYLNSNILPVGWYVIGLRGYFTFISMEEILPGPTNNILVSVAKSEDDLEAQLNGLSGAGDVLFIIPFGGFWVIVSGPGATVAANTVTTYKSAQALADATGLEVVPGLDDSTGNSTAQPEGAVTLNNLDPADLLTTYGGNYTLIRAVPSNLIILQKGGFYTTILIS